MGKRQGFSVQYDRSLENLIKTAALIGKGHNGIVYKLKNGKVMKIFKETTICKEEYATLKKASKLSKNFPKVYLYKPYYIIRDFVPGIRLDKYLKQHPLCEKLAKNIIALIEEFKKLKFKRLDIRCKDIYVQLDLSLKVIDPKHQFRKVVSYPRHLMKGLDKLGVMGDFFVYLKKHSEEEYHHWKEKFDLYKKKHIK